MALQTKKVANELLIYPKKSSICGQTNEISVIGKKLKWIHIMI
jgi:hypothetical protein